MDIRSVTRANGPGCQHLTVIVEHGGREHALHVTEDEVDAVDLSPEQLRHAALQALKVERVEGKDITAPRPRAQGEAVER